MANSNPSHDGRNQGGPPRHDKTDYEQHKHDLMSDPAHNDEVGQDWTDEGGAMPEGPATHQQETSHKDNEGEKRD